MKLYACHLGCMPLRMNKKLQLKVPTLVLRKYFSHNVLYVATIVPFIVTSLTLFIYEYTCENVKSDMPYIIVCIYMHCS